MEQRFYLVEIRMRMIKGKEQKKEIWLWPLADHHSVGREERCLDARTAVCVTRAGSLAVCKGCR